MKDLKHLIYFENLLDSANNELVQQAKDEGMHPIAYTCYHMPEVVLNVDNCFSVRLRAPKTGSFDIASYYSVRSRASITSSTPSLVWTPARR